MITSSRIKEDLKTKIGSELIRALRSTQIRCLVQKLKKNLLLQAHKKVIKLKLTLKKRTNSDLPVHSFQTLLADLATVVKNKIQSTVAGANFTFDKITEPTIVQQRAIDLLDISLICTQ